MAYAIIMLSNGIYPKDANGNNIYKLKIDPMSGGTVDWNAIAMFATHLWPFISFGISTFSGAFGIATFFLSGPISLVPKKKFANGILSSRFMAIILLSSMYTIRMVCIEETFFSRFVLVDYARNRKTDGTQAIIDRIGPKLPEVTRIIVYFFPALLSIVLNLIVMCYTSSVKISLSLIRDYPQFFLSPGFSPFIFRWKNKEKESDHSPDFELSVSHPGTILNAIFIGCVPQIGLIISHIKNSPKIQNWIGFTTNHQLPLNSSLPNYFTPPFFKPLNRHCMHCNGFVAYTNSLFSTQNGPLILGITTLVLYFLLIHFCLARNGLFFGQPNRKKAEGNVIYAYLEPNPSYISVEEEPKDGINISE
jgi:hypothetical protein